MLAKAIEQTAKAIFVRYNDKDFSFVDCTSFALIDHHRIDHVLAFDGHFRRFQEARRCSASSTHLIQNRKSEKCHLITLSARTSTLGGTVKLICLAVLRLMTSSILSIPSTGKSLGLTPARMRWTYFADTRPISWKLTL